MVEFLQTCDSALVNPIVFAEAPVSVQPVNINIELMPAISTAPGSSSSDDMKSANEDSMLLNYNDFLIKSVHERKYSAITKKLSDDISGLVKYHIGHALTLIPTLMMRGAKMVMQNHRRN